jgi:hypothetical protein
MCGTTSSELSLHLIEFVLQMTLLELQGIVFLLKLFELLLERFDESLGVLPVLLVDASSGSDVATVGLKTFLKNLDLNEKVLLGLTIQETLLQATNMRFGSTKGMRQ